MHPGQARGRGLRTHTIVLHPEVLPVFCIMSIFQNKNNAGLFLAKKVIMKPLQQFYFCLALTFAAVSCGKISTIEYKPSPVILTAEGPLFEGSNTAQGTVPGADLESFLSKNGYSGARIKSARLVSAQVFSESDTLTLDNIGQITLQLAAKNVDMQQVAVLNPVPEGKNYVDLQVAAEQEKIADLIRQSALACVADLNLKQDAEATLNLTCKLVFELQVED